MNEEELFWVTHVGKRREKYRAGEEVRSCFGERHFHFVLLESKLLVWDLSCDPEIYSDSLETEIFLF